MGIEASLRALGFAQAAAYFMSVSALPAANRQNTDKGSIPHIFVKNRKKPI